MSGLAFFFVILSTWGSRPQNNLGIFWRGYWWRSQLSDRNVWEGQDWGPSGKGSKCPESSGKWFDRKWGNPREQVVVKRIQRSKWWNQVSNTTLSMKLIMHRFFKHLFKNQKYTTEYVLSARNNSSCGSCVRIWAFILVHESMKVLDLLHLLLTRYSWEHCRGSQE